MLWTCATCGRENEFEAEICTACGAAFFQVFGVDPGVRTDDRGSRRTALRVVLIGSALLLLLTATVALIISLRMAG